MRGSRGCRGGVASTSATVSALAATRTGDLERERNVAGAGVPGTKVSADMQLATASPRSLPSSDNSDHDGIPGTWHDALESEVLVLGYGNKSVLASGWGRY